MPFQYINFDFLENFIKKSSKEHLVLNGFLSPFDLFLVNVLLKNKKKILYITPDEQASLKNQKDLESLFNIKSEV